MASIRWSGSVRTSFQLTFAIVALIAVACGGGEKRGVSITTLEEQGEQAGQPSSRPAARAAPAPPSAPPPLTVTSFKPRTGYTSMIADRRGVYWLGGGGQSPAVVMAANLDGTGERVLARPRRAGEALGRPLPIGDWVVFPETRDTSPEGGPWAIRAVLVADGQERLLDGDTDGWEGLSLAVSGSRLAYTVAVIDGPNLASEVRLWDSADDSRRTALKTPPGVTLQRISYDGQSAAAVRTSRNPDGSVLTDVVELDLLSGQVLPLAPNATLPAISPRWIVWVTIPLAGAPNQLILYDRESRTRQVIAESGPGRSLHNPSITGSLITWNSTDTATVSIYDAAQRALFPLDRGVVGKVWAHDGTIVWTALNPATGQYEMRVAVVNSVP